MSNHKVELLESDWQELMSILHRITWGRHEVFDKITRLDDKMKARMSNLQAISIAALADQFIAINSDWFSESHNAFYGMERACRLHLREKVETGEYPEISPSDSSYKLIYLEGKFDEFVEGVMKREQASEV